MACRGCSRNKKSSGSRIKSKKSQTIVSKTVTSVSKDILINRKRKCSNCPFNTSSGLTGRCKKVNRLIERAINDPNFKCPIKRF